MVGIGPRFIIMLPVIILLLFASIAVLVLLVWLCIKKPWVGAIVVLIFLFLFASVFVLRLGSYRRIVTYEQQAVPLVQSATHSGDTTAAIWSPGIEDEFVADVYPSKISAIRGLGRQINKKIPFILEEVDSPEEIVIFQNAQELELVEELRDFIAKLFPDIRCRIAFEDVTQVKNKIGVYFYINNDYSPMPVMQLKVLLNDNLTSGTIRANIVAKQRQQASVAVNFVEKPWIEDFTNFINRKPHQQLIIARSSESCLSEGEANRQAMENACSQIGSLLTNLQNPNKLSSNDILENGLIVDRFVQSFEGTAGKIWRQALLVDASSEKLNQLVRRNVRMARARKFGFIRTISSIAGLFILIIIVYAFLNVATKGYYTWSLRVAGVVLAVILIFLLFA